MGGEDLAISTKVRRVLSTAKKVSDLDIDVETLDGIVYLRGEVRTEAEKAAATEVARSVTGVREVRNQLAILDIRPPDHQAEHLGARDHRTDETENDG
jgi:osmotically-inducible protein OsmY